ncbi:MAG: hypothetical protein GXP54_09715, partial [Deltaproteobacteria bacterium]|nr:hypothetical protein [Deltaproteobacteria bacterium]
FLTAPDDECTPYTFIALGDDRSDTNYGPNPRWNGIIMEAMEYFPLFVLNTGDIVRDGSKTDQWKHWLEASDPALAFAAHMPTIGNHDDGPGDGDGAYYNQVFNLPRNTVTGTEDYYFFTTGNAVFVSLSTETFKGGGVPFGEQAAWLDTVLTENPRMWKIVYFHKPIYCSEDWFSLVHPPNEEGQNAALTAIFDKHHVDMVFYGHNHWYERLGPMKGNGNDKEGIPVDKFEDGTVYVVTGGAGALTFNVTVNLFCPGGAKGSKVCSGDHHFVKIDIDHNKLTYTARTTRTQLTGTSDSNAKEIDSFTIVKPYTGPDPCLAPPPVDSGPEPMPDTQPEPVPDAAEEAMQDAFGPDEGPAPADDAVVPDVPVAAIDAAEIEDQSAKTDIAGTVNQPDIPTTMDTKTGGGCLASNGSSDPKIPLAFLALCLVVLVSRRRSESAD